MPVSRSMLACLMAFKAGSTDCNDAFPMLEKFFKTAGIDTDQVAFADGRGGNPTDRFTPESATDLLCYWLKQPQANEFRELLPVMGVDGSLEDNCKDCPAKRKVFAKVGTVGLPDFVNGGLVDNESLGGTWRSNQVPSTSSTWWSTARGRTTSMEPSRASTTSTTSLPSCKKSPRARKEAPRATDS
jgi:hypothetical protein